MVMIMSDKKKETYYHVSEKIDKTFLAGLSHEKLNERLKEAYLGIIVNHDTIANPLVDIPFVAQENFNEYLVYLMSRPEYFYFIMKVLFGMKSFPLQCLILKELFDHRFPILLGSRGLAKSTAIALYCLIRLIITPGIKCVITGAGFRQAKIVFEMMERIWETSPMLKNCFKGGRNGPNHGTDAWSFRLGDSICWALPVGHDGQKVRGFRSNLLFCDEFASLPRSIFEEVMSGFLTVSAEPVEQIQHRATINAKKKFGIPVDLSDYESDIIQNQLVLSGTAYYKHNHFYEYFTKWRSIINSGGDSGILNSIFSEKEENRNWKHYSIIRIPVELIPEGFMDMDQINRIKASVNKDVFLREYSACFSDDSDGFFKRSLIEFCTLSLSNKIIKDGQEIKFNPVLYGDKNKKYVYGVDPAYQGDNFAIVILEINGSHRRVVHCWTTQASDHKQMLKDFKNGKSSIDVQHQYFDYCARKIRTLMKRFPCAYIALDAQGGGRAIMESLMDPSKLEPGEEIILPAINPDEKPLETDMMQGDHIIKIFKNTSETITEANHALKKDMESRDIIFPYHDSISYVESEFYDTSLGESSVLYDTLEDCIADIEELKNELSTIAISETKTGRESFDTPETKGANSKKGRLKKDRYSALLMANWVARSEENLITRPLNSSDVITMGGYVDKNNPNAMFIGNSKLAQRLNDLYS